jgi:hypothetical protein
MERAVQLDPFFPGLNLHVGRLFFFLRDYDRAMSEFAKTLELHPATRPHTNGSAMFARKKEWPAKR